MTTPPVRLLRQISLYLREGTSDKVYEVDLCEAGEGEFVVNFRYGRRGTTLREGTKTTFPVTRAEAEAVYAKLVESKTSKGYSTSMPVESEQRVDRADEPSRSIASDPRARRVLRYLKAAAVGEEEPAEDWPLSRVLWRAGEMELREAAPLLARIAATGDPMHDLSLAWALARCGEESSVDALQDLFDSTTSEPAKRLAEAGLLKLLPQGDREAMLKKHIDVLPASVAAALYGAPTDLVLAVQEALQRTEGAQDLLFELYLVSRDVANARVAVLEAIRRRAFGMNTFRPIRRIYKVAELTNDSEVYGLLAYRFEKTPESHRRSSYENAWRHVAGFPRPPESQKAYSQATRAYLRRRSIRTLLRRGELDLDSYAQMAAGVLLAFSDEFDRKQPRTTTDYVHDGRNYRQVATTFDIYDYPLLNNLLYRNSPRYVPQQGLHSWPCAVDYRPGQLAPATREEAFPKIWDRNPAEVIRLLRGSRCVPVQEFAAKVFRANPAFVEHVDVDDLIEILSHPYEVTTTLAIELARRLYVPSAPNVRLVSGLATCASDAGRRLALSWIEEQPDVFLRDSSFFLEILFTVHADVHTAITRWASEGRIPAETLHAAALEAIDRLMSLDRRPGNSALAEFVGKTLVTIAREPLRHIEIALLTLMLDHPLDEVQALAGRLLLRHEIPAAQMSEEIFEKLINAKSADVRRIGVELFGTLPDDALLTRQATLASYATSRRPELRESVRPVILRLAASSEAFAQSMVEELYPLLARKERYEGLHGDVYRLLVESLGDSLAGIPREHIDKLLDGKYERAQELGAVLLQRYVRPGDVPMRRLVALASHESLAVREWVRSAFRNDPQRVKSELEESVRIVDSTWDDSREFAFGYFRTQLDEHDWKPEVLVSIADSVNPAVQALGRELITRFFDESQGQTYLLRLSQHPSPGLQLFATNYLERFAAGQPDRIEALELYFVTVLCQVNRGRVAKDRVLAFLRREAMKSEAVARLVTRVLVRQSATLAIGDKASCIETLRDIRAVYPQIEMPLTTKQPPIREVS